MLNARETVLFEISTNRSISFAQFMEIALYHAEDGYYSSGRAGIGKSGDFYTNVSVGSIFSRILYTQFEDAWNALGRPKRFPLVEFGAHDGLFALDILRHAASVSTPFSQALEYDIVESQPALRQLQHKNLRGWPHRIHSHWQDLPPLEGMVFANELLDAFPVHLVEWSGCRWMERRVREKEGQLQFTLAPILDPLLESYTRSIPLPLPPGYITEVCPLRQSWLRQICQRLIRGGLLFADYGYRRTEFFAPYRTSGTLACYRRHRRTNDPLTHIGEQDLTSHVEFTSFAEEAEHCGLTVAGFADQHHFLTAAAEPWLRSIEGTPLTDSLQADLRHLQTLLHPAMMGSQFHFLAFTRDLTSPVLSGFHYSAPPWRAL